MSLVEQLTKYRERIDALSLRERVVVFLAILAVVYLLWDGLVYSHVSSSHQSLRSEINSVQQSREALNQEMAVLIQIISKDPDEEKKLEKEILLKELEELEEALQALSVGLISASELPAILQSVLKRTGKLRLQKIETMPIEIIELSQLETLEPVRQQSGVFKHTVALRLTGNYLDVIDYLQVLEDLDWRFYWESVEYEVDSYPRASIEIRVYTLSTSEGAFGV